MDTNIRPTAYTCKVASYKICKANNQFSNIKTYLLNLMQSYPNGLTCVELVAISEIEKNSLTNPLCTLVEEGKLVANTSRRNSKTNKLNTVYRLPD